MTDLKPASEIKNGKCFRKKNGEYVYLRISESAVRFLGLDETKVYGVCFNGNVTCLDQDKLVEPMAPSGMATNRRSQARWEQDICKK